MSTLKPHQWSKKIRFTSNLKPVSRFDKLRGHPYLAAMGIFILTLFSGCAGGSNPTPAANTMEAEIVVYASDLPQSALFELDFIDDTASPGGVSIGLPNNGDELDPPPEDDPHVTFTASVQNGIPYRCWIHMEVGTPKGRSQANVIWVQFSNAVDAANQEVFKPGSSSYLTAQGPTHADWTWVGCNLEDSDALIYFQSTGEVTARLQAGAEGVAFDQFILSSARFLDASPAEAIVVK